MHWRAALTDEPSDEGDNAQIASRPPRRSARQGARGSRFLPSAQSIVTDKPGTTVWFAFKFSPTRFGVLPDGDARNAHLAGGVGQVLVPSTDVLFSKPPVETVEVLAGKLPVSRDDSDVWV